MTPTKPAVVTRYSNASYRVVSYLTATQQNPFGGPPDEYTIYLEAMHAITGSQGTVSRPGETSSIAAVKITADNTFEVGLDRYADGGCLYKIKFTKQ